MKGDSAFSSLWVKILSLKMFTSAKVGGFFRQFRADEK